MNTRSVIKRSGVNASTSVRTRELLAFPAADDPSTRPQPMTDASFLQSLELNEDRFVSLLRNLIGEAEYLQNTGVGTAYVPQEDRAITPVLEDLVSELSLSLDYVESREGLRVDEVLLSGGAVLAPGAVSFIEQATGRSARTWNPLEGLRVDESLDPVELEAFAPSLAVAIGLASRVCAE